MKVFFKAAVLLVASQAPFNAQAQFGVAWYKTPDIAVVGAFDDSRRAMVGQAIDNWNQILQEVGSGFRLGSVAYLEAPIPDDALISLSNSIVEPLARSRFMPPELNSLPASLTIYLSDAQFVSFAGPFNGASQRVVAIKSLRTPPLSFPNVALNVLIHERRSNYFGCTQLTGNLANQEGCPKTSLAD
jgi:hypothetical protein